MFDSTISTTQIEKDLNQRAKAMQELEARYAELENTFSDYKMNSELTIFKLTTSMHQKDEEIKQLNQILQTSHSYETIKKYEEKIKELEEELSRLRLVNHNQKRLQKQHSIAIMSQFPKPADDKKLKGASSQRTIEITPNSTKLNHGMSLRTLPRLHEHSKFAMEAHKKDWSKESPLPNRAYRKNTVDTFNIEDNDPLNNQEILKLNHQHEKSFQMLPLNFKLKFEESQRRITEVEPAIKDYIEALGILEERYRDLEYTLEHMERANKQLYDQQASSKAQIASLMQRLENEELEKVKLIREVDEFKEKLNQVTHENSQLTRENKLMSQELHKNSTNKENDDNAVFSLKMKIVELESQRDSLADSNYQLQVSLEQLRTETNRKLLAGQEQLDEKDNELEKLRIKLDNLFKKNREYLEKLETDKEARNLVEEHYKNRLEEETHRLQHKIEDLNKKIADFEYKEQMNYQKNSMIVPAADNELADEGLSKLELPQELAALADDDYDHQHLLNIEDILPSHRSISNPSFWNATNHAKPTAVGHNPKSQDNNRPQTPSNNMRPKSPSNLERLVEEDQELDQHNFDTNPFKIKNNFDEFIGKKSEKNSANDNPYGYSSEPIFNQKEKTDLRGLLISEMVSPRNSMQKRTSHMNNRASMGTPGMKAQFRRLRLNSLDEDEEINMEKDVSQKSDNRFAIRMITTNSFNDTSHRDTINPKSRAGPLTNGYSPSLDEDDEDPIIKYIEEINEKNQEIFELRQKLRDAMSKSGMEALREQVQVLTLKVKHLEEDIANLETIHAKEREYMKKNLDDMTDMCMKAKVKVSTLIAEKDYLTLEFNRKIKKLTFQVDIYESHIKEFNELNKSTMK